LNTLCYAYHWMLRAVIVAWSEFAPSRPIRLGRADNLTDGGNTIHPLATAASLSSTSQYPAATTSQAGVLRESFGDAGVLEHPALA
jgi:hypothetical protein